jgi:hypothetical protein
MATAGTLPDIAVGKKMMTKKKEKKKTTATANLQESLKRTA